MTTLKHSIVINASIDKLDAITLDGNRFSEWYEGIEQSIPDSKFPDPGGVVETVYRTAGIKFNVKMISLAIVRSHYLIMKMEGMITGTSKWEYIPDGDGVRVTCTFEYEMPGGGIGKALNKLVVERMNDENLEKSLGNLKALVEAS